MGIYFVVQPFLKNKDDKETVKKMSLKDTLIVALALASNNLGVGVAASVSGLSVFWVVIFTFITSILTILIGISLGDHIIGKIIGKYDSIISGILLIILGIISIF